MTCKILKNCQNRNRNQFSEILEELPVNLSKNNPTFSLLLTLFLLIPSLVNGSWKEEFQAKFSSPNSWEKEEAIEQLDGNQLPQLKLLLSLLNSKEWYIRQAAWKKIAQIENQNALNLLKKELRKRSRRRYKIREGIVIAITQKKDRTFLPLLIRLLKDSSWQVVRSTAKALAAMPDKRSISPLIQCWKKHKKRLRVWVYVRIALEKITGRFLGNDYKRWQNWWKLQKNSFQIGQKNDNSTAEEQGYKTKRQQTVLRGVGLNFATRGRGRAIFVLPDYGYNEHYLMPYLAPLEANFKLYYIKLPPVSSFQNLPRQAGRVVYPIDQLVDAFEELRIKHNQKKIAILGHGVSAWVAMKYAIKYPQSVRALILVAAFSGQMAYTRGVTAVESKGRELNDIEMEHFAQSLQIQMNGQPKYQAQSMQESMALMRKEWTLRFADQSDSELGELFEKSYKPDAEAIVPPFELRKYPVSFPIPTLVILGKHALMTSAQDGQAIAKHFGGKSRCFLFPISRRMPFIEENRRFIRYVRAFLR
ncbi:MAG: alpha/beta fold hydrolase [Planctomycetota bacterium]|nr:MAG: alpha/beta fold hydrolase [Planctomycetota bacterium]